jgi:hypothetical protein
MIVTRSKGFYMHIDLLLETITKSQVCYEERILLDTTCLSPPAGSELLALGGFPSASAAPRHRAEPKRLHSASLTSCGTRHHTRAHCDQVRVEHLNLDAQFLQPPPVQKHGVGAHPMTRQHRMFLKERLHRAFHIDVESKLPRL